LRFLRFLLFGLVISFTILFSLVISVV